MLNRGPCSIFAQGMQTVHKIASLEVATSTVVFLFKDDYSYQMLLPLLHYYYCNDHTGIDSRNDSSVRVCVFVKLYIYTVCMLYMYTHVYVCLYYIYMCTYTCVNTYEHMRVRVWIHTFKCIQIQVMYCPENLTN